MDSLLELLYNDLIRYLNGQYKKDLKKYFNTQPNIIFHCIDNLIEAKLIHDINMRIHLIDVGTSCVTLCLPLHIFYTDQASSLHSFFNEMKDKIDLYIKRNSVDDELTYILLGDFSGVYFENCAMDTYSIKVSFKYATHTFNLT